MVDRGEEVGDEAPNGGCVDGLLGVLVVAESDAYVVGRPRGAAVALRAAGAEVTETCRSVTLNSSVLVAASSASAPARSVHASSCMSRGIHPSSRQSPLPRSRRSDCRSVCRVWVNEWYQLAVAPLW